MALKIALVCFALCIYLTLVSSGYIPVTSQQAEPDERVVGGEDAAPRAAPHMVALVFGYFVINFTCGGSIISKRLVLTAAHCIDPFVDWDGTLLQTLGGVVGSNQWNTRENLVRFSGHINHPNHDHVFIKNDVGVLILQEELQLSPAVNVIQLNYDWVDGGVDTVVYGWGTLWAWGPVPDNLQKLNLKTMSGQDCIDAVLRATEVFGWAPPVHPVVEICTIHYVNHGICHGDSGSPLEELVSGTQVGIGKWGFPCARGAPDMYARVSGFRHFLEPILQEHQ